MPSPRVLCYSPYGRWPIHADWEATIVGGLKMRGADVTMVTCDGVFTDCDVHWRSLEPRTESACADCRFAVNKRLDEVGIASVGLSTFLDDETRESARDWVASLADDELTGATFGDWPVHEWAHSSVQSDLRASQPDLSDPVAIESTRGYCHNVLLSCHAQTRMLDEIQPDAVLVFNGRMSTTRSMFELARRRGIRVVTHERSNREGMITLLANEQILDLGGLRSDWEQWKDVPLSQLELNRATGYLRDRRLGRRGGWTAFASAPAEDEDPIAQLRLDPSRPTWALFTSSDDEIAASDDWLSSFESQLAWIERTIAFARSTPEINLVVRAHPNTGSKVSAGANVAQLKQFEELAASGLPANVRIVAPDDTLSTYALIDAAAVGLTWVSTVGLEMAVTGKPVVTACGGPFFGTEFVTSVEDEAEYETILTGLLATTADHFDAELRRAALRHTYLANFRRRIDFPLVRMLSLAIGERRYGALEDLVPGHDAGLDRAVGIILDGRPTCEPPTATDRSRSTSAEDRHLAWQQSADPTVTVVIGCHNYGPYLAEAALSVLDQDGVDLELTIIDDGSTDESLTVANSLARLDPRIRVMSREASGQPAIPRNDAIAEARGRYILSLDADDRLGEGALELLVGALDNDPEVGLAYPQVHTFGDAEEQWPHLPWSSDLIRFHNIIASSAVLFPQAAWEAAGGYGTNLPGREDWDLWLGIVSAGYRGHPVPGAIHHYRKHGSSISDRAHETDRQQKAQMVINRSELYGSTTVAWAERVLAGTATDRDRTDVFLNVPRLEEPGSELTIGHDANGPEDWWVEPGVCGPWPGVDAEDAVARVDLLGFTTIHTPDGRLVGAKRGSDPRRCPLPFLDAGASESERSSALVDALTAVIRHTSSTTAGATDPERLAGLLGIEITRPYPNLDLVNTVDAAATTLSLNPTFGLPPAEFTTPISLALKTAAGRAIATSDTPLLERVRQAESRINAVAGQESRAVQIIAFADEAGADPQMLRSYADHIGPGDDVTLVLVGDTDTAVAAAYDAGIADDGPDMTVAPIRPANALACLSRRLRRLDVPRFSDGHALAEFIGERSGQAHRQAA